MGEFYEAVAITKDGTFRANVTDPQTIAITEDGVAGITDVIHLHPRETSASSKEHLQGTLKWWVHENVRGIEVVDVYLNVR
jgi:hypothetical protein